MSAATKARIFGAVVLLVMLWAIGSYNFGRFAGLAPILFAVAFELLVARPLSKSEPPRE
jgi:hypothetical protein